MAVLSDESVGERVLNRVELIVSCDVSGHLKDHFEDTRAASLRLCEPLKIEDFGLQRAEFVSPPKWHLAHTSWFFETFLLKPFLSGYVEWNPAYEHLFNSYYNSIGQPFPRPQRGLLSRPAVDEIKQYRQHVDTAMLQLLSQKDHGEYKEIELRCRLGIEHEQQHQELICTDIKYSLAANPLLPGLFEQPPIDAKSQVAPEMSWLDFAGGVVSIGHEGDAFAFDNELPRHRCFIEPYQLASRLVTNAEYRGFMADGGYDNPELWLADGWAAVQQQQWRRPLYWMEKDGELIEYSLHGIMPLLDSAPVCHLSAYEADAYARWANARLPTEEEWEHAACGLPVIGCNPHSGYLHPRVASSASGLQQLYNDCWQWTRSAYSPYPGYKVPEGAIGEYNGKFMSNQWVLRGGSCVSSPGHLRLTYRNFFYPDDRWQFAGLRLARSVK